MTADGVDLIDEDDARRLLLGLLEHVTHTGGTDTDEHLDEVRTGDAEERHLGFTGDRLGEQGLAGTRRAYHQDATRNLTAKTLELAGILEEVDQLLDLFLRFVTACDVAEGGLDLVLAQQLGLGLAEAHRATLAGAATLHLAHEEHEDGQNDQNREAGNQQACPQRLLLRLLADDLHLVGKQVIHQLGIGRRRPDGGEAGAIGPLTLNGVTIDGHTLDPVVLHLLDEL